MSCLVSLVEDRTWSVGYVTPIHEYWEVLKNKQHPKYRTKVLSCVPFAFVVTVKQGDFCGVPRVGGGALQCIYPHWYIGTAI